MNVLHIVPSLAPEWGGPPVVVMNLTEALKEVGVDCTIFATIGYRVGKPAPATHGVTTKLFPTGPISRLWAGFAPGLLSSLREEIERYDLVHIHELWHYPHFAAYRAAKKAGKRFIITPHGELNDPALREKALKKSIYMRLFQRRALSQASAIHVITDDEARMTRRLGLSVPIVVHPNGVKAEQFQQLPSETIFLTKFPELQGNKIVLFLGRIHPIKGLDLLARAFAGLVKDHPDVRLVIAGADVQGYQRSLEALLTVLRVRDKTLFTGHLSHNEKLAALSAADIFALTSYSEVIGLSSLEAMAAGVPVIITRQCQFPEAAESNAGFVVDTNPAEIESAMRQILDDPEAARDMGQRGRALVSQKYTWGEIAKNMASTYEDVLSR
jgi:glycosyltransferase involved in cell wall biosynthesis